MACESGAYLGDDPSPFRANGPHMGCWPDMPSIFTCMSVLFLVRGVGIDVESWYAQGGGHDVIRCLTY